LDADIRRRRGCRISDTETETRGDKLNAFKFWMRYLLAAPSAAGDVDDANGTRHKA